MDKKFVNTILHVSFGAFALASAVTTFIGVALVLESLNVYIRYFISFLISFATSGVMLYIGLNIPHYFLKGKVSLPVLAYFSIALISVFFNFVTFYQGQIMNQTLSSDTRLINAKLEELYKKSLYALSEYYKINEIQNKMAVEKAGMDSEKDHAVEPGEGGRWQKHFAQYNKYKQRVDIAKKEYNKEKIRIDSIYSNTVALLKRAENENKIEQKEVILNDAVSNIDRLNGFISLYEPRGKELIMGLDYLRVKKPDYMLSVIVDMFYRYNQLHGLEQSRFMLSMFLAVMLDIPIFMVLMLLGEKLVESKDRSLWK